MLCKKILSPSFFNDATAFVWWPKFHCFLQLIFSMFEKSWKYHIFTSFVDRKKVYDRLANFGGFCWRIVLMVSCYMPSSHSMMLTGILWLGKWQAIKGFIVGVESRRGCVLFPLFFIVYMNWIDEWKAYFQNALYPLLMFLIKPVKTVWKLFYANVLLISLFWNCRRIPLQNRKVW